MVCVFTTTHMKTTCFTPLMCVFKWMSQSRTALNETVPRRLLHAGTWKNISRNSRQSLALHFAGRTKVVLNTKTQYCCLMVIFSIATQYWYSPIMKAKLCDMPRTAPSLAVEHCMDSSIGLNKTPNDLRVPISKKDTRNAAPTMT